ncbi:glycosyltransferase [Lactococcus lactis]|uniref:glycosyltransferase n=1 Tax=Lactococcus lactis TaxID=1358 RepID=UPI00288F373B|nr:glycosyltransferase [Lactococcus lactis]MDT2893039.1 glycosyltransferase [Lactococcus lactis]MDT2913309.1 glycosyltransferase [Lactococcus lactis]MDT2931215.1 glycosyltransferase [Lactococcus lactis]MDT2939658.1 glycosyltransferase [Lactococcus lactis]
MKPKILQMGADNFGAGGRSVIAYNMTRPLTNDFQVDFLAIGKLKNPSFHRIIEENGGHVQHVKEVSSKIKRLRSIYSILKKEKYDIVHINVDDAIEGLFNIILSKLSGAKIVLHAHTTSSSRGEGFFGRLKMLSAKKIVNFLVDYKMACSLEAANYLYGDTDLSDVAIIKNGIIINDFLYNEELRQNVRENLNIPMEAIVLGTVGRLSYQKNPEFMVSLIQTLFSKAPNFYFIWIGDGEERASIEKKLDEEIKSGRILLLGKQEQPAQYLQAMDVFLLPSLYEGFGIVNIEAQASGLPCVVSSAVPDSASVNSNFYRLLLSDGVEKWSEFITSLSFERLRYGSAEKIKEAGFDIEDSARKLRTIYQKLVK